VLGKRRALFRMSDLVKLADLVADIRRIHTDERKENSAASVNKLRRSRRRPPRRR
jgi:hypothetical protein